MRKYLFLFMATCLSVSCADTTKDKQLVCMDIQNSTSIRLHNPFSICSFHDEYPAKIACHDSLLYVIMAKSHTCIYSINMNNGHKNSIAHIGSGHNEWIEPDFINNNFEHDDVICYDITSMKYASVKQDGEDIREKMPSAISRPDQLNISHPYWIGKPVKINFEHTLEIYNAETNHLCYDEIYPDIDYGECDRNYICSPVICFNSRKDRIVAGMFFFDLIKLYSTDGKLQKILTFTDKPDFQKILDKMQEEHMATGYSHIYGTQNHCYIYRRHENMDTGEFTDAHIIKIDWEGNLKASYILPEGFTGSFCVDSSEKHLFAIERTTTSDNEIYHIVSYLL